VSTTTFDEPFDPDKDAFAVILSPSAPDRAYDYTVADALLDVRADLAREKDREQNFGEDVDYGILAGLNYGIDRIDEALIRITSGRIALDSLPPVD
jgi:hypothetical protein